MKNLLKIFAPENRSLLITLIICATALIIAIIHRPSHYHFSATRWTIFDDRTGRIYEPLSKCYYELDGTEHKTGEK